MEVASSMMFSEIAEKYKEHFKVILIDFLGHGKSEFYELSVDFLTNE